VLVSHAAHRWIDSGYHPLPQVLCEFIHIYIISLWSFSWYFGASIHYYYHQQPVMTQPVNRSMSLALEPYIYSFYEPPDDAQEPLIRHHFNANNNFYRGFPFVYTPRSTMAKVLLPLYAY
jgi:hypothetical protein